MNIFHTAGLMKRLHARAVEDPARDWLVLIILSTILLAGIIVWNVWAFDTVASGGSIGGDSSAGGSSAYDLSSLDSIRTLFEDRATEAAKYETGVYRYADPSQ